MDGMVWRVEGEAGGPPPVSLSWAGAVDGELLLLLHRQWCSALLQPRRCSCLQHLSISLSFHPTNQIYLLFKVWHVMCHHHSDLLGKDLSENYERERKYLIALVPFKYLSIVSVFFIFLPLSWILDFTSLSSIVGWWSKVFLIKFFKHLTLLENFLLCIAAYNFEVSNIGRRSIWE